MKPTIPFCFISLLMIGTAQANYAFKIPLEESNGGGLPNGSISIKSSTITPPVIIPPPLPPVVTPPAEPTPECLYAASESYWKTTVGGSTISLLWKGTTIFDSGNTDGISIGHATSYAYNGYNYTKGTKITFSGPPEFEICRIIILL